MGHKANECTVKINEIDQDVPDKNCDSIEIGRVWNVCAVSVENKYAALMSDDEDEVPDDTYAEC